MCAITVVNVPECWRARARACRTGEQQNPGWELTQRGRNYGGQGGSVTGARFGREAEPCRGFRWTGVLAGGLTDVGRGTAGGGGEWKRPSAGFFFFLFVLFCLVFFVCACGGAQILRFLIVSALLLSRSPTSCSERR